MARLLDASIDTIIEVGYAKASAAVIARRASVSDGALFRHFPTMGDFMAATAYEVMRRQLDLFTKLVTEIPAEQPPLESVLTILRDVTANDTNTVMYELMVAARTDEKLKATLRDVLTEYATNIHQTARGVPGSEQLPEDVFTVALAVLVNTFDGAAVVRAVLAQPELEGPRIALLTALLSRST